MEKISRLEAEMSRKEKGASLVEYALLCCLISVAAIAAIRLLGTNISSQFSTVATQIG